MGDNSVLSDNIDNETASPIDNLLSIQVIAHIEQYFKENMNTNDIELIKANKELISNINKFILDCCETTKLSKERVINRLKSIIDKTEYVKGPNGKILLEIIKDILKEIEEDLER